ncbi:F-box only protein 30 [Nymphon striatum]|nr:F-box only protein 30 [Nymphon striatum]
MESIDYGIHLHCLNCIRVWSCKATQEGLSCAIVNCSQDCGARFHQCKTTEHHLLCPNEKVPCLNSENGCPVIVPRKKRGSHLATCPASVIHCSIELDYRQKCVADTCTSQLSYLPSDKIVNISNQSNDSLVVRDQHTLVNCKLPNDESNKFGEDLHKDQYKIKKYPPGLQQSVCQELLKGSVGTDAINTDEIRNWPCSKSFRRDEYSWHYKNIHSEIHKDLNGWIKNFCPVASYGCEYVIHRLHPNSTGSLIIHDDILDAYAVKFPTSSGEVTQNYSKLEVVENKSLPSKFTLPCNMTSINDIIQLIELPFEILQNICRNLDSFSLYNISKTCRLLREVCFSMLEERGIVTLHWDHVEIDGCYKWKICCTKWFFSTASTPITKWVYGKSESMGQHLQTCAYNERDYKSEPFFYPCDIDPDPKVLSRLRKTIFNRLDSSDFAVS